MAIQGGFRVLKDLLHNRKCQAWCLRAQRYTKVTKPGRFIWTSGSTTKKLEDLGSFGHFPSNQQPGPQCKQHSMSFYRRNSCEHPVTPITESVHLAWHRQRFVGQHFADLRSAKRPSLLHANSAFKACIVSLGRRFKCRLRLFNLQKHRRVTPIYTHRIVLQG